ncbi:MAG: ABC transporter permease [Deltaproteobacteria bacterium]|nr:ABC transporter permease [Deltaproteobacteria bacterium]
MEAPSIKTEGRRIIRVMFSRRVAILGFIIAVFFMLTAIFGPLIAPYDPIEQNINNILEAPSREHFLGTDDLGRDILSRIIYGARVSLMVGVVAVTISAVVGMSLGLIAGYFNKWVNNIIMRIIDAFMALPSMVLILAIASILGGGLFNVMIVLGIGLIPTYCRLMCAQVLSIKENDYIISAKALGSSDLRIILRHVLPNAFPPLLVLITLQIGTAILMEASLSFLGIGISPPTATWGSMVSVGYNYLLSNPLLSFAPGIAILLVVLAFNLIGDGLRDALDPRLRGTL